MKRVHGLETADPHVWGSGIVPPRVGGVYRSQSRSVTSPSGSHSPNSALVATWTGVGTISRVTEGRRGHTSPEGRDMTMAGARGDEESRLCVGPRSRFQLSGCGGADEVEATADLPPCSNEYKSREVS